MLYLSSFKYVVLLSCILWSWLSGSFLVRVVRALVGVTRVLVRVIRVRVTRILVRIVKVTRVMVRVTRVLVTVVRALVMVIPGLVLPVQCRLQGARQSYQGYGLVYQDPRLGPCYSYQGPG